VCKFIYLLTFLILSFILKNNNNYEVTLMLWPFWLGNKKQEVLTICDPSRVTANTFLVITFRDFYIPYILQSISQCT